MNNFFDSIEEKWKSFWNKIKEKLGLSKPEPTTPTNPDNPTTPNLPVGENLTDEEAQKIIPTLQYMEGCQSSDPNVLRLVKMYGRRITHFGGGNKPNQPKDETYLWKPESDNDGKLVVITPSSTYIKSCSVGGETKTSLSIGNGWRPHFRFSKSGVNGYGSAPVVTANPSGSAKINTPSKKQSFKVSGSVATNPEQDTPSEPVVEYPSPRYAPGTLVIPPEFLKHGKITELRLARVSVANGGLKQVSGRPTTFTVKTPSDPAWQEFANGASASGSRCKCSDGSMWDGYLHNNTETVPMPIYPMGQTKGHAFWVKVK